MTRMPPKIPTDDNGDDNPAQALRIPWKTRLFMSAVSAVADASIRRDGTVNRRFLSLFHLKSPPNATPVDGVSTSDHVVDPARNLRVRLFTPTAAPAAPAAVVVYFHGGGFTFHSAFSRAFDALCRRLSRRIPARVVSVDYRLAPEHRHPAAYDDGLDVLRWLDRGDLVADLSAVFLAGDTAGGNIAHHVARRATATPEFVRLRVEGVVGIQPFFGGEGETESERRLAGAVPFGSGEKYRWMWRSFLPVGSGLDHEAANVFGPGSGSGQSWAGFPRTMVVIGGLDMNQDRQRWYCEGLKGAGVDVSVVELPNAVHGFYAFPELPEAKQVIDEVANFIQRHSAEGATSFAKDCNSL